MAERKWGGEREFGEAWAGENRYWQERREQERKAKNNGSGYGCYIQAAIVFFVLYSIFQIGVSILNFTINTFPIFSELPAQQRPVIRNLYKGHIIGYLNEYNIDELLHDIRQGSVTQKLPEYEHCEGTVKIHVGDLSVDDHIALDKEYKVHSDISIVYKKDKNGSNTKEFDKLKVKTFVEMIPKREILCFPVAEFNEEYYILYDGENGGFYIEGAKKLPDVKPSDSGTEG